MVVESHAMISTRLNSSNLFLSPLVVLPILFQGAVATATIFPKQENTEVIYLGTGRTAVQLVNQLMNESTVSLDALLSSWAVDEVGSPMIETVRTLVKHNINVNIIYDAGATAAETTGDMNGDAGSLMADSSFTHPPHLVLARFLNKISNGLVIDDYLHQKFLIIDAGRPTMKVIVQGGNFTETANHFIDSFFLLRPISPDQPWVGTTMSSYYGRIWEEYSKRFSVLAPAKPSQKLMDKLNLNLRAAKAAADSPDRSDSDAEVTDPLLSFSHVMEVIHNGQTDQLHDLDPIQFRPASAQFVTNDLFMNFFKEKGALVKSDMHEMPDDISDVLATKIYASKNILLSNYGGEYNWRLKSALQSAMKENRQFEIVTNSPPAFESLAGGKSALKAFMATASNITISEENKYLEQTASHHNLHVYLSNQYRHAKLGIADETFWQGSANLTISSSYYNDECMIFYEDPRLAQFMRKEVQNQLDHSGFFELTLEKSREWVKKIPFGDKLLAPFVELYL